MGNPNQRTNGINHTNVITNKPHILSSKRESQPLVVREEFYKTPISKRKIVSTTGKRVLVRINNDHIADIRLRVLDAFFPTARAFFDAHPDAIEFTIINPNITKDAVAAWLEYFSNICEARLFPFRCLDTINATIHAYAAGRVLMLDSWMNSMFGNLKSAIEKHLCAVGGPIPYDILETIVTVVPTDDALHRQTATLFGTRRFAKQVQDIGVFNEFIAAFPAFEHQVKRREGYLRFQAGKANWEVKNQARQEEVERRKVQEAERAADAAKEQKLERGNLNGSAKKRAAKRKAAEEATKAGKKS